MHGGVEDHPAPRRHLLKPAQLTHGGDHAPGEQADVGEGRRSRDAGLGAHQGLREPVVLGQPPIEGVLGHRSVPTHTSRACRRQTHQTPYSFVALAPGWHTVDTSP